MLLRYPGGDADTNLAMPAKTQLHAHRGHPDPELIRHDLSGFTPGVANDDRTRLARSSHDHRPPRPNGLLHRPIGAGRRFPAEQIALGQSGLVQRPQSVVVVRLRSVGSVVVPTLLVVPRPGCTWW